MSLPCLESTGGHSRFTSLDKHISSQSAKSGSRTRHSAPGVQLLRIQICPPTCCCPGGIPFAQAHTLPSFSLKGGKNGKAGFGRCFFSFCFEILAVKPGWPMVCGQINCSCSIQSSSVFRVLQHPWDWVPAHLPLLIPL